MSVGTQERQTESPEVTGLGRLAGRCYDRRRLVLVLWILALVGITVVAQMVGTHFQNKFTAGSTQSQQAADLLSARFPSHAGDTADVVFRTTTPIAANEAAINGVVDALRPLGHVSSVTGPFSPAGAHQISTHANIAYAVVQFDETTSNLPTGAINDVISTAEAAAHSGFQVALGGYPISSVAKVSPGASEGIGITAAIIIMLLAFGSVVAMGLPIITALFGLGIGVALLELVTHFLVVPNFSPEMAAMIGIGVGIDYALFIVTRYRQGIFEGRDPRNAVVTSLMTSGRSVLFAGGTVVISLFGLFLIGQPYMIGLATACIAAVLMVLVAALTLLPAMLGFAGSAIDKAHIPGLLQSGGPPPENGFWHRWSRLIQRRAWVAGGLAIVALVALALPMFGMRLAFTDASNDPTTQTTRQAYDLLSQGFGVGFNGPLVVAVDMHGPADQPTVQRLESALRAGVPDVAFVAPAAVQRHEDGRRHHRDPEHLAPVRPDRDPRPDPQERRHTTGGLRDRRERAGRRADCRRHRRRQLPREPALPRDRRRARAVLPVADDRVPQHRDPAQGGHHEPAERRRRLRCPGRRVPVGVGRRGDRDR